MTVRKDVFTPEEKKVVDPVVKSKEVLKDEAEEWESKKKAARAKREYEDEERAARLAREREESPPEAPFKIEGSVNLGHFDMQAAQEELKATTERIQKEAKEREAALNEKSDRYRDELQKIQIEMVEKTLTAEINHMAKIITDGLAKPKDPSVIDRIDEIAKIAGIMGYKQPSAEEGLPSEIRLQMLKMDMDEKKAQRQFEWDKMMSERNWQLELKKLEQSSAAAAAQIQQEREKRGMLASPFESIGAALARGLIDSGGKIEASPSKKRKRSEHKLQANEGDSGVVECPECEEPIAIAPTARSAVCPSCETVIAINRIPQSGIK